MKKIILVIISAALILTAVTCSKKTVRLSLTEEASYNKVYKEYETKKYTKFLQDAKYFLSDYPASKNASKIQFLLGETHLKKKEYEEAIMEYQRIIDKYSDSEYLDDAYLKIAESYYVQKLAPERDQSATKKAIYYYEKVVQLGGSFTEESREKIRECRATLALKEYYIARYYHKSKEYETSNSVLDEAIKNYSDSTVMAYYYYLKAYNYFRLKDIDKTKAMLAMMEPFKPFDAKLEKSVKKLEKKMLAQ